MALPVRASPSALFTSLVANRALIASLVRREVAGRYRGSALGLFWAVLNPVLMLAVYTFVFSEVFQSRWQGGTGGKSEFALVLFAGLLVFNFFSECVNRAPTVILGNVPFVKRVVFPLEVLPVVTMGSALFHLGVNLVVWGAFYAFAVGVPHPTLLLLPLTLLPLVLVTLGISWLLAALGVYLRDVAQAIGLVTLVLMFLSPVFYQLDAMPAAYRPFLYLSPLTVTIEQVRDVMYWGRVPSVATYGAACGAAALIAWLGFLCFQRTRRGFADVL